jgi:hypothetical protein
LTRKGLRTEANGDIDDIALEHALGISLARAVGAFVRSVPVVWTAQMPARDSSQAEKGSKTWSIIMVVLSGTS